MVWSIHPKHILKFFNQVNNAANGGLGTWLPSWYPTHLSYTLIYDSFFCLQWIEFAYVNVDVFSFRWVRFKWLFYCNSMNNWALQSNKFKQIQVHYLRLTDTPILSNIFITFLDIKQDQLMQIIEMLLKAKILKSSDDETKLSSSSVVELFKGYKRYIWHEK